MCVHSECVHTQKATHYIVRTEGTEHTAPNSGNVCTTYYYYCGGDNVCTSVQSNLSFVREEDNYKAVLNQLFICLEA